MFNFNKIDKIDSVIIFAGIFLAFLAEWIPGGLMIAFYPTAVVWLIAQIDIIFVTIMSVPILSLCSIHLCGPEKAQSSKIIDAVPSILMFLIGMKGFTSLSGGLQIIIELVYVGWSDACSIRLGLFLGPASVLGLLGIALYVKHKRAYYTAEMA